MAGDCRLPMRLNRATDPNSRLRGDPGASRSFSWSHRTTKSKMLRNLQIRRSPAIRQRSAIWEYYLDTCSLVPLLVKMGARICLLNEERVVQNAGMDADSCDEGIALRP